MNCRFYFAWLIVLILCSSAYTIPVDRTSSKCFPQCMSYCTHEEESGIPANLCNAVCTSTCYSGRRDVGNENINAENDK